MNVARCTMAFFVLFLAVQLIVPIVQLAKPRPAQFGWQMFCDWRPIPKYWVVGADGAVREVDFHAHVAVRRLDADYHSVMPEYLCRRHPDAVAVRWQWPDADEIEERRCR